MDFLRNRYFRQTLLVRGERQSDIQRNIRAEQLTMFQLSANIKTQRDVNVTSSTLATFESAQGRALDVTEPIIKAALLILGQRYPKTIAFEALFVAAAEQSKTARAQRNMLLNALLALTLNGLLELQMQALEFAGVARQRPRAIALARQQARAGNASATNQRHEQVTLNPFQVALLAITDGERSVAEIEHRLTQHCVAGEIGLQRDGVALNDAASLAAFMPGLVEENLRLLESAALLE